MAATTSVSARNLRLLTFALAAPGLIFSAALLLAIAAIFGLWPWGVVLLAVWLASGPLVLRRGIEDAVVSGREGLRRPTEEEMQKLLPAWRRVCSAASRDPGDFSLWVEKSYRINAFATAGHTVAVTEAAAGGLPIEMLEAVLAHELGHHVGGHTRLSMLLYWYSLPASYLFQAATLFGLALSSSQLSTSRAMRTVIPVVLLAVVGGVTLEAPIAGLIVILFLVSNFGMLWVRRRQEFEADAIANSFGYGQLLSQVLSRTAPSTPNASETWMRRIGDTHPSNDERIRRLKTNP